MTKKCIGCGVVLQDSDALKDGYAVDLDRSFCMRCFKMRNYGEYSEPAQSSEEYLKILKNIGETRSLVLLVVDLLSVPRNLKEIRELLKLNKVILVLNKKDALPLKVSDKKYIDYFNNLGLDLVDVVVVSSKKNYNLDLLLKTIKKHRKYKKVYVVGSTNAGKSTLLNSLIRNYSVEKPEITVSPMPSTTLNEIEIPFLDFTLIDTPGVVDYGNVLNYVSNKLVKKISPKKEIKPRTYQLKKGDSLIIEDIIRIDYLGEERNSYTLYISNDLKVKRVYSSWNKSLKDLSKREMSIDFKEDIVINGLGFIKTVLPSEVVIYSNKDIEMFTRDSLI